MRAIQRSGAAVGIHVNQSQFETERDRLGRHRGLALLPAAEVSVSDNHMWLVMLKLSRHPACPHLSQETVTSKKNAR